MPDAYTSQFSGEEIDAAVRAAQIISGASTLAELRKKLEIRGDTIPVSAEDSTLISEALTKIPTTSGGGVNPNLLDNWYFGRPVNQRGQTEYSGDKYTVDRWHLTSDGVLTVADEGIRLTSGALFEPLEYELSSFLKGKTVTYSFFFADNTLVTKSAVIPSTWGNWDSLIEIGDIQLIGLESGKRIWVRYSSTTTAVAAKLELGDTQTLAHKENGVWVLNEIPDFGEQLRRCQRYYVDVTPSLTFNSMYGGTLFSTGCDFLVPIPVTLRESGSVPVVICNPSEWQVAVVAANAYFTPTSIRVSQIASGAVSLRCLFSHSLSSQYCDLRKATDSAKLILSKDL
jgi:hypothetical protein|nr:MAG TPA: hypothetical protein [Caudoviricetes sp.]